jgi:hypothetical protein
LLASDYSLLQTVLSPNPASILQYFYPLLLLLLMMTMMTTNHLEAEEEHTELVHQWQYRMPGQVTDGDGSTDELKILQ